MEHRPRLVNPRTLEAGKEYLLLERGNNGHEQVPVSVQFAAYDACPAFVIVRTEFGKKHRCPREEVFTPPVSAG